MGGSRQGRRGQAGRKVAATVLPSVDLVVCGSVAVNRQGARIGKGGGFPDLEVAFLVEAGVLRPDTVLATTVRPLQVLDEPSRRPSTTSVWTSWSPRTRPSGARATPATRHPLGASGQDKIAKVPALAALATRC
jgi:5-formyltetrahydrofolate cyclo-ligase